MFSLDHFSRGLIVNSPWLFFTNIFTAAFVEEEGAKTENCKHNAYGHQEFA